MKQPFFYFEIVSRASRVDISRTAYDINVKCANLGYGHHRDPVLVRVTEMDSVEEAMDEARQVMDESAEILEPGDYIQRMIDRDKESIAQ